MEEDINEKNEKSEEIKQKTNEQVEGLIERILNEGIQSGNLDMLGKLVDIHKDLANEDYWKKKEEVYKMRYMDNYGRDAYGRDNYGTDSYGRRGRDSRGRYTGRGMSRYAGEDMLEDMMNHYNNYSEGKEMYGTDGQTLESFKYMVKSFKDYYKHLKENASSQEEVQILDNAINEMSRM